MHSLRGWFALSRETIREAVPYDGFDGAVAFVRAAVADVGADALLGFSQGAALASYLLRAGDVATAILISPYPLRDPRIAAEMAAMPGKGRALVVAGSRDDLVPPEDSRLLLAGVAEGAWWLHAAGHVIPATSAAKQTVLGFLDGTLACVPSSVPTRGKGPV